MKKPKKKKECAEVRDGTEKKNPYNNVMINYVLSLNIYIFHTQTTYWEAVIYTSTHSWSNLNTVNPKKKKKHHHLGFWIKQSQQI